MKIKNGFVLRVVGGESVVVPVGEMSKKFHGMINLNETGAFLWISGGQRDISAIDPGVYFRSNAIAEICRNA